MKIGIEIETETETLAQPASCQRNQRNHHQQQQQHQQQHINSNSNNPSAISSSAISECPLLNPPTRKPMKPAEKRSAPEPDSATHLRSRGAGVHHASTSAVAEKQAWDRASAYFRSHYASAASASAGPGWGHEQATIAAAASGSTGTCAAKEPLLWGRMWAPDVEDVPLPQNFKRVRTEDSEEAGN